MLTERLLRLDRGDAGRRLDHVLRRHLADRPDASRTRIQDWIAGGAVTVDGVRARRAAGRISAGAEVLVALPPLPERREHAPEDLPLDVLHEDDHLLAIAKPAGLVVHPSFGHASGTLVNALLWRAREWPQGGRPRLVHRLDKHTSGVVLVAKSREVHASLARALSGGSARKDYLAVVAARVPRARGEIRARLGRDPADRRRVIVTARGRECLTLFERLDVSRGDRLGLSLLRCRLVTGRLHQIRVHLSSCGWPVVGDASYGLRGRPRIAAAGLAAAVRDFPRQALHAWRLSFEHPVSGRPLELVAPIPPEIVALLSLAGMRVPGQARSGPGQAD